jgi:hypothetical protein
MFMRVLLWIIQGGFRVTWRVRGAEDSGTTSDLFLDMMLVIVASMLYYALSISSSLRPVSSIDYS